MILKSGDPMMYLITCRARDRFYWAGQLMTRDIWETENISSGRSCAAKLRLPAICWHKLCELSSPWRPDMSYLATISRKYFHGSSLITPMIGSHWMTKPMKWSGSFSSTLNSVLKSTMNESLKAELSSKTVVAVQIEEDCATSISQQISSIQHHKSAASCRMCENRNCATMSIPYRTKSCRMEAKHWAPCSISILIKLRCNQTLWAEISRLTYPKITL